MLWFGDGSDTWAEAEAMPAGQGGNPHRGARRGDVIGRYPALNPCILPPDLAEGRPTTAARRGHLLEVDGGYVDPVSALQDLIDAARGRGVEVRFKCEVIDLRSTATGFPP